MIILKSPREESANGSIPRWPVNRCWNLFQKTDSRNVIVSKGVALAIVDAESAALFSGDSLPAKIVAGIIAILEPFNSAFTRVVIRPSISLGLDRNWSSGRERTEGWTRNRRRIAIHQWISKYWTYNKSGQLHSGIIICRYLHDGWGLKYKRLSWFHVAVVANETGKTSLTDFIQLFYSNCNQDFSCWINTKTKVLIVSYVRWKSRTAQQDRKSSDRPVSVSEIDQRWYTEMWDPPMHLEPIALKWTR